MDEISYKAMLRHRCHLIRLNQEAESGSPVYGWNPVLGSDGQPLVLQCFLDLNYIRQGKDPQWTPETGRTMDRTGVWFGLPGAPIKSGDRIQMTVGPPGTFEIQGAIDQAWTPRKLHHVEAGVVEVAAQRTRATEIASPYDGRGGTRAS